jgi:EpsI family protein
MSIRRFIAASFILVAGIVATRSLRASAAPQFHRPLRDFPSVLGGWQSADRPFAPDIVKTIGVDDYTNRRYFAVGSSLGLYVGYYKDQGSGDLIHSPKNCLPGTGWEPVRSGLLQIGSADRPVLVNEYIVQKGAMRDLVLYWYQSHGRIISSEYWAKFWLVADGVRHRSTDGALIRIWTTAADGEERARARASEFARVVYPNVSEFLPN